MFRIHLYTVLGCVFLLSGIALIFSIFPLLAVAYFLAAYLFSMKEVSVYTSWFQFVTVFISALCLGLGFDYPFHHFPFFILTFLIISAGSLARMVFFRTFAYAQYSWFEPLMLMFAFFLYLIANLVLKRGWSGWIVPLPVFFLQSLLTKGIFADKIQLTRFARGGYKVGIGTEAPDFELPDEQGQLISLASFRDKRHLLLIFVRGDWCPGCHMMLRTYQKEAARFKEKNIYAMAIGPDPVGVNREMVEKLGLDFKVLSDDKQRTAMIYGVQLEKYSNEFAEKYEEGIPLPASFLIDRWGKVQYVSRPDKIGEFLDPRTIFPIIDKLK